MKNFILIACLSFFIVHVSSAQVSARMFRTPDVSQSQIVFSYGGDIWIVDKEGGTASKLSSPSGTEGFPRFSPDGSQVAFSGNYDGNYDIYVMPSLGGIGKERSSPVRPPEGPREECGNCPAWPQCWLDTLVVLH